MLPTMDYHRIQPFPDPAAHQFPELRALAKVWDERKAALSENDAYLEFNKKLQREWAIETGIIERLYTWDRGVTEVLIEQGIEASIIAHRGGVSLREAEHVQAVIGDHLEIVEGLFGYIKSEEPLTEHFIRGLQARFTRNQEYTEARTESGDLIRVSLVKGEYKTLPNNPRRPDGATHQYCPPELCKEEMESLVRMFREGENIHTSEVKAAWLHHRFTQIHPFQDGNGRVARALTTLVFLRDGLFPLVVRDSDRREYIGALESADSGDLAPLVGFFAMRQREAILKALGIEQQVQQGNYAKQIVASAIEVLRDRFSQDRKNRSAVYQHAGNLLTDVKSEFQKLVELLGQDLPSLTPPGRASYHARFNYADNQSPNRNYFHKQIIDIANMFAYFANFESFRAWARVTLSTDQVFDYVVSFHGYGPGENGVLAASAFTYIKAEREDGGSEIVALRPAATELFQFNYAESPETTRKRFAEWLEASMAIALGEWKRSLQAGA